MTPLVRYTTNPRKSMRVLVLLALSGVLAACSTQPAAPQPSTGPAVSEPGKPGSETVVPVPVAAGTAEAGKSAGKIPSGFRRETRNGKELFCRQSTISGSRFPTEKTCFTREQLEDRGPQKESATDDVEQEAQACGGGTSCDNGT
jgi:hypothetical protein